jgi:hypothetical protein
LYNTISHVYFTHFCEKCGIFFYWVKQASQI